MYCAIWSYDHKTNKHCHFVLLLAPNPGDASGLLWESKRIDRESLQSSSSCVNRWAMTDSSARSNCLYIISLSSVTSSLCVLYAVISWWRYVSVFSLLLTVFYVWILIANFSLLGYFVSVYTTYYQFLVCLPNLVNFGKWLTTVGEFLPTP